MCLLDPAVVVEDSSTIARAEVKEIQFKKKFTTNVWDDFLLANETFVEAPTRFDFLNEVPTWSRCSEDSSEA